MKLNDLRSAMPPVPDHFLEVREKTLMEICRNEEPEMKRRYKLTAAAVLIAALLLTAGAVAAGQTFGILDFLNWNRTPASAGVEETFQNNLGQAGNKLYSASVEEAYFDGSNFMIVVRYDVKNPQDELFVSSLFGYWRDDEGFYRVSGINELQGPADPWQTLNEYEDAVGGDRRRIYAITPELVLEDDVSWGGGVSSFHQPDGSLIYVHQGMISQPAEGALSVTFRCGAVAQGTEKPTEYEEIQISLEPSETVWQAEYVPDSEGEGWSVERMQITSGRMLMRAEIEFVCAPETLHSDMDYWNISIKDRAGNEIALLDGGGETETLPEGGFRCLLRASLLSTEGCPEAVHLYLKRDGALPLGPIECRLTE